MVTTVLYFLIVIGILVFIHEFGHFIVAKRIGVEVEKFSLGFGPKLLGFKRKGTEYLISLFPLGGYVKIKGENPGEELKNDSSEFSSRKVGDRIKIVLAGPLMNIILAFLLLPIVFMIGTQVPAYLKQKPVIGWIEADSPAAKAGFTGGDRIERVDGKSIATWENLQTVILSNPDKTLKVRFSRGGEVRVNQLNLGSNEAFGTGYAGLERQIDPVIGGVTPLYPAEKAGLKTGDKIISINGVPIVHWNQISPLIQKNKAREITCFVQRGEKKLSFSIQPKLEEINGEKRPFIGIMQQTEMVIEKYGFFASCKKGTQKALEMSVLTIKMLKNLICFNLSVKALGCPIMIAQLTGQAAQSGISEFLFFLAYLSLSLGIINLFPIPILDGGHILFFVIEFLRGKPLGVKKMELAQQIGLAILILLMVTVTYNDILRILPSSIKDLFPWK